MSTCCKTIYKKTVVPELPDLQVFSDHLNRQLAGRKLLLINPLKGARVNVPGTRLKKALEGRKLVKVYREGKELRLEFTNQQVIGLHLMLHGKLEWMESLKAPKYSLLELHFQGGKQLCLTDYQRQARIALNPEATTVPDALAKTVNTAFWKKQLQTKATIKNLLLDQHVIRGIGNAYADEILWQARISPLSVSNKIPANKIKALATAVKQVLKKAIQQIHKEAPGIIGGEMRDFLLIHHPGKKKSPEGALIKTTATGGRKTYYTNEQELFN
jgi:formamidopyrimidine-DNA glycosylase